MNELISEPTNLPLIQNLGVFIESRLCIIMSIDLREDDVGDIAVSILFAQFSDSSVMQRVKISISKECHPKENVEQRVYH